MSKRFTDTNKYKKPFIRGLKGAYKLLWDYLYHDCDNAGIWIVDFDIAQLYLGKDMQVNRNDALAFFNSDELRIIDLGSKWFIPSFIEFQYGEINPENPAHKGFIKILKPLGLIDSEFKIKLLKSSLKGAKDKDMDKDKDLDKEMVKDLDKEKLQKKQKFEIPKIEDVILDFELKKSDKFEAEKFYNFYESKNWMVGKNRMANWRAAISGWINRNSSNGQSSKNGILKVDKTKDMANTVKDALMKSINSENDKKLIG